MEIFFKIRDNLIVDAEFTPHGCGRTVVCGGTVTKLAKGRDIREALEINAEKVLDELGGFPESDQHCARLAADTLRNAIMTYLKLKREPWKKFY